MRILRSVHWLALLFLLLQTTLAAAQNPVFPSAYYPTGPHPRIWLTAERLATLKEAMRRQTPQWQRFKAQLDTYMDPAHEDWAQWVGYCEAIPYTALMYQLTGQRQYAQRALYCVRHAERSYDNAERYWIRNNGYLAMGYDWIYDALTPAERQEVIGAIVAYDDSLWADAHYSGDHPTYTAIDTDRDTKGSADHLLMGCAIHGDSPRSVDLLNRAWWGWARGFGDLSTKNKTMHPTPIRQWIRDAAGGTYYTGLGYAMNTDTAGLAFWFTTLRTACRYDVYQLENASFRPFWSNMIRSALDQLAPDRETLHNMGDWQDPPLIAQRNWYYKFLTLIAWEADQAGDTAWAARARGLYDRVTSWHSDPFVEFVFSYLPGDAQHPSRDPWAAGMPPVRACQGVDMLYFRSDWSTAATWGVFSCQGGEPTDHQSEDTGSFALWRGGNYLTKTATGYRDFMDAGYVHNAPSIENGRPNGSTRLDGDIRARMARHRENNAAPLFAYAMLNADGQWNLDRNAYSDDRLRDAPVKSYRRHFFWSGDYAVVCDRLRTARPVRFSYRLRCPSPTTPTLNAAAMTISQLSEKNTQRLFHRTLEPAGCAFALVNEAAKYRQLYDYEWFPAERHMQYLIEPAPATSLNMLSVMQMGAAGLAAMDATEKISGSGNLGVRIGNWAVVFADSETTRTSAAYRITAPAGGVRHLICDLKAGRYQVKAGAAAPIYVTVAEGDNTAYFTTSSAAGPLDVSVRPALAAGQAWGAYP